MPALRFVPGSRPQPTAAMSDLTRVPGLRAADADLLLAAGVPHAAALKHQNVYVLIDRIRTVCEQRDEDPPTLMTIAGWIERARAVPAVDPGAG